MQIPNCPKIRIDSNEKSTFFPILLHCDMCESIYMHIYFNNLSYNQSKRKLNFILSLRPTSSMAFILRCKIVLHKISLILLTQVLLFASLKLQNCIFQGKKHSSEKLPNQTLYLEAYSPTDSKKKLSVLPFGCSTAPIFAQQDL